MRGKTWSPGRPSSFRREGRVAFWKAIARGVSTEDAAFEVGMSSAVGTRWFREAGGMSPCLSPTVSGRYLSFAEHEEIAIPRSQQFGYATSLAASVVTRQRSRVSCVATRPPEEAKRRIGRPRRSGMPSDGRAARRSPSSSPTKCCGTMSKTVGPATSSGQTASSCWDRRCGSSGGDTDVERIGGGRRHGAQSRSRTD